MSDGVGVSQGELILFINAQVDVIGTHISIFLTVVSAYLVISYLVGDKLTRPQVAVATSIYIVAYVFESIILAGLFRALLVAMRAYEDKYTITSEWVFEGISGSSYFGLAIILAIFLSSLWFMWSVRHPKETYGEYQ